MDKSRKKKPAKTDAKSKKIKNVKSEDASISGDGNVNDVSVVSTSFGGVSKTPKESQVCSGTGALPNSSSKTPTTPIARSFSSSSKVEETPCSFYKMTKDEDGKPSKVDKSRKKKPARTDAKNQKRKNSKTEDKNVMISTSCGGDPNTPKESKVKSGSGTLPSSSSKTPSTPIPRSLTSTLKVEKTPCSFYKVTEDEDGKPVFSKSLLKYFMTVDSPEMDDLKKKRWNTSFLHETPKPNRFIKIFTEEEDNNPKYLENVPDIDSNLPDVPGSLHADIFKRMPINDSDEELKTLFQEITPVKGPKGRRKRKPTRISCYNGKPLADELLSFNYSGLLNTDIGFDDDRSESKENIIDIKIEEV